MSRAHWSSFLIACIWACGAAAQPCLIGYTLTASTPPTNGTYACGETVTFCLTIDSWNTTNANWFHGVVASFGPGWDMASLSPGAAPAPCGTGGGTWGWYNSVQGTAGTSIGAQGPGFFYDLNNDGTPGNNFGDFCTGPWTFCWTISVLSGPACVNGLDLGVSVNTFGDSETGSWGSTGCTGDVIVPSTPAVIQSCAANAGIGAPLTVCSTSPPIDLFATLGGGPDAGGTWTDANGAPSNGLLDPLVNGSGNYTYTVGTVVPPCSSSSVIAVTVIQQPDAGNSGSLTLCASNAPATLVTSLLGTPDAGGTWSGPSGPSSGTMDPAVDPSGTYTYTIAAAAPCVNASADVLVTINPSPNAGGPGVLSICSDGAAETLFTHLTGTPSNGGTWSGPSGSAWSGTYDPALDTPGNYTYTIAGTAPCPNSSALVSVTENQLPLAGADAVSTLCSSSAPVLLTSLLEGTPDANGTWTVGGLPTPALFDPAVGGSGSYTYSVAGLAPCPNAQATLTLSVVQQPWAGTDGTLNVCVGSVAVDLTTVLGNAPDAGGTWSDPAGAATAALFDPATDAAGIYTYTVPANVPCVAATATVLVNVSEQPSAGTNAAIQLCSTDPPTVLFAELGPTAQPGGTWTDPSGAAHDGTFLPGASANGFYTYTIIGIAPCTNASANVHVTTFAATDPGVGGPLALCSSASITNLSASLTGNPTPDGIWTTPSGGAFSGSIDPATASSGNYTYTVSGNGPCPAQSTAVAVAITPQPNAGINGNTTLCSSASVPVSLLASLGGSPSANGAWSAPDGSPHGNTFSASTDPPGTYTYVVTAPPPCASATSTVLVGISQAADAGTDASVTLCENGTVLDPFASLGGTPDSGGTWTDPGGSVVGSIDPAAATSGVYTYTVNAVAPCPAVQASLQVTIDALPNAGTNNAIDLCADANPVDMLTLLGAAQNGGSWLGPSGAATSAFDPAVNVPGTYTYTVPGTGACAGEQDQATLDISVLPLPQPSFTVSDAIGCVPLSVQFMNTTTPSVQNAVWTFGDGSIGTDVDSTWHTYSSAGQFHVTLEVEDANGCNNTITSMGAVTTSAGPSPLFYALPLRVSVSSPTTWITQVPEEGISYLWSIESTSTDTSGAFPWTFDPATIGDHPICLTATDTLGCANTYCIDVLVDDDLTIFVANAFTPNGDDHNDTFRPSILGVESDRYEFMVFDRWGLLVFRTTDPMEAWNGGMDNSGDILPDDVYVWTLKAKDQFTPEKRDLIGTVTLVK